MRRKAKRDDIMSKAKIKKPPGYMPIMTIHDEQLGPFQPTIHPSN